MRPEAIKWLKAMMAEREWGISATAKAAGLSHPVISDMLNLKAQPSFETCRALARAFGLEPRIILEIFGLLDPLPHLTPKQQQLISLLPMLGEDDQDEIIGLAEMKAERIRKKVKGGKKETARA